LIEKQIFFELQTSIFSENLFFLPIKCNIINLIIINLHEASKIVQSFDFLWRNTFFSISINKMIVSVSIWTESKAYWKKYFYQRKMTLQYFPNLGCCQGKRKPNKKVFLWNLKNFSNSYMSIENEKLFEIFLSQLYRVKRRDKTWYGYYFLLITEDIFSLM